jgi:hypothetical protein
MSPLLNTSPQKLHFPIDGCLVTVEAPGVVASNKKAFAPLFITFLFDAQSRVVAPG